MSELQVVKGDVGGPPVATELQVGDFRGEIEGMVHWKPKESEVGEILKMS